MKIKSPLGTDLGRARLDQIMISPAGSTPAGENISTGTKWKVNWTTGSGKFVIFNNQIKALDGTYQDLPPVLRDPWEIAALEIPNALGCGCKYQHLNGQKLYRNVNLNLAMRGAPGTSTPPDTHDWLPSSLASIFNTYSPPWATDQCQSYPGDGLHSTLWLFLSDIQSALWCIGPCPQGAPWIWDPGDIIYDFCRGFSQPRKLRWCTSVSNGLPSSTGIVTLGQNR